MFPIAFDLVVADTAQHHPKGVSQAYFDIGSTLAGYGFERVQGSLYTTPSEDLANLLGAIMALRTLPWLPASVRDIRAFRVEQWSDFTNLVKGIVIVLAWRCLIPFAAVASCAAGSIVSGDEVLRELDESIARKEAKRAGRTPRKTATPR